MLNFRKLKQDFSPAILKEGKQLYDNKRIIAAKILHLDSDIVSFHGRILSNYDNTYECELEIDRFESQAMHSNCDCPYQFDCLHLAALVFYLEEHIDSILIEYSKETNIDSSENIDETEKEKLLETFKAAETKAASKLDASYQREILSEYLAASELLSTSAFFLPEEHNAITKAELAFVFNPKSAQDKKQIEFQLALRLPGRSKPLQVPYLKNFLEAVRYEESNVIAGKQYFFSLKSFNEEDLQLFKIIMNCAFFPDKPPNERAFRIGFLDRESFGILLSLAFVSERKRNCACGFDNASEPLRMRSVFANTLETPLSCSLQPAALRFELEYIAPPGSKLLVNPTICVDQKITNIMDAALFECVRPGLILEGVYYGFGENVKRQHLLNLTRIREMSIPEPLFGTFVENALPELRRYANVAGEEVLENFITLPFVGVLGCRSVLSYLDGELEAMLYFNYDGIEVRSGNTDLDYEKICAFQTGEGIVARNLVEEKNLALELFQDFIYSADTGVYVAKTEKKIVEFMTEIVPRFKGRVDFECPQNLLDQFIYDRTRFMLSLSQGDAAGQYKVDLKVDGALKGLDIDLLWECVDAKRSFIELKSIQSEEAQKRRNSRFSKILVLDLDKISRIVQIFDEMGIRKLSCHVEERPLWSLVAIDKELFSGLPITFKITDELEEIRRQMLGEKEFCKSPVPKEVIANFRPYQTDGVHWLERLRSMYLNGILADDMGLGKTLQAIAAITQVHNARKESVSIVVCPTSLIYNWKEEVQKFQRNLKVLTVDGSPSQRQKLIHNINKYDLVITSYTLLQKDVELYKKTTFAYAILDEAQHIKNRLTRNAKSAKMINAVHRLILTGTPIENSLEELWSLFDFLMAGFLGSFDRFVEKYMRQGPDYPQRMEYLKRKVSPFILRRMKVDVLKDLPPVSEIIYHCQLANTQQQLYQSYAKSARDELVRLVEKDGFEKVQIHVLATLTRLKQICCHPAIFAKEKAEAGDSAKYEMLMELLQTLMESKHKTVIFSQYTRMLHIIREDLEQRGISFSYLDGSSKNRLQIVKEFNETKEIPIFLVSLKAGGTGLNITGADTVIHYDMWWNPAVENQATDRVHRIGQTKSVSTYKLITKSSIEEKIVEMQERKKGLVKKIVSCDDEAISKLTWEEVLELLQA